MGWLGRQIALFSKGVLPFVPVHKVTRLRTAFMISDPTMWYFLRTAGIVRTNYGLRSNPATKVCFETSPRNMLPHPLYILNSVIFEVRT